MRPEASARLSVPVLVEGYTINGAKQLRWQDKIGSLEKGKRANLIVIDRDPFETPIDQLKDIKVEAVVFDGNLVNGEL